nr:MAG TPA: hypothetical protein [Caudoviricetes sp.]
MTFDLWQDFYSRALLDFVQLEFAVWGIIAWRKESPDQN